MKNIKTLLYNTADDNLIIGHRNSEWIGLGPVLEEDISFASIAQDKIGHAYAFFTLLHEDLGESKQDEIGFLRDENDFYCAHIVEYPNDEYDFSLIRQLFVDLAFLIRYEAFAKSTWEPLAKVALKIKGEVKYHVFHGETWLKQLANGNEEAKARMQQAINKVYPMALALFEHFDGEDALIEKGIYPGEDALKAQWITSIGNIVSNSGLAINAKDDVSQYVGGRKAYHTLHLQPLLNEMTAVFRLDPTAEW